MVHGDIRPGNIAIDGNGNAYLSNFGIALGIWMSTGDRVVEVLLDAELWVDRACVVVARDFTQTEWDLYVPGDRPLRPVCGEGT